MKRRSLLLGLVASMLFATGCLPEDLGSGLFIVNETNQKLVVLSHTVPANGGTYVIETNNCIEGGLEARMVNGDLVAELAEKWCPGQTWTITGKGESTLTDGK